MLAGGGTMLVFAPIIGLVMLIVLISDDAEDDPDCLPGTAAITAAWSDDNGEDPSDGPNDLSDLPDPPPMQLGDTFGLWDAELDAERLANAEQIVAAGADDDLGARAWVIALATAMIESQLLNIEGGDRDSLGLFQQRPSTGWGEPQDIMDPTKSSHAFYGTADHMPDGNKGLLQIENTTCPTCDNSQPEGTVWYDWPAGDAAQAVQISGHPSRYAQVLGDAVALLKLVLSDGDLPDPCPDPPPRPIAEWVCPIDTPVTSPFGQRGGRLHAGTDFGGPTGVPIYTSKAGEVAEVTTYGGYGNTVVVDHQDDTSTLYAHQSRYHVEVGDLVRQGDQIGEVGNTGRSTGPHLHFEIRVDGVGLEGTPMDPQPPLGLPSGQDAVGIVCEDLADDEPAPNPGGDVCNPPPLAGPCITDRMRHIVQEIDRFFPDWPNWGLGCQSDRGGTSDHDDGAACDYTVGELGRYATDEEAAIGWQLADWVVAHADTLEANYVIWDGLIWSQARRDEGWRTYTRNGEPPEDPTWGHYDHIHISAERG